MSDPTPSDFADMMADVRKRASMYLVVPVGDFSTYSRIDVYSTDDRQCARLAIHKLLEAEALFRMISAK